MRVLHQAVGHHRHRSPAHQLVVIERLLYIADQHLVSLGKTLGPGKVRPAVDHRHMPTQQLGHAHQRLGIMARAEDHQTPHRRQVLQKHFHFAETIRVETTG